MGPREQEKQETKLDVIPALWHIFAEGVSAA